MPTPRQEIVFAENKNSLGRKEVIAYASLRNKDWLLVFVQPLSVKLRDLYALQRWMIFVLLFCIAGVFLLALGITRNFVGRLKEAEQEHEALLHKIEHTNKLALIGRLAAGVAHEINNPLAIINEMAGLMKDKTEMADDFADKKRYLQLLQTIHGSVDRCRAITHRLLGFARQMDVSPEVIDVNDLIREVLGFLEKEAFHRSIRIDLDLTEPLPTIESDRGQLQQVLLNVINNAMHAVDNGGEIFINTWANEEKAVTVKIRDNGCGIPADKLNRIFEPFFTTKGRGQGTGLGLSITYGIINKLGGKVSVESEVDKGTTFIIELPGYMG
jgi:two-component system NtrC family sensor kinase